MRRDSAVTAITAKLRPILSERNGKLLERVDVKGYIINTTSHHGASGHNHTSLLLRIPIHVYKGTRENGRHGRTERREKPARPIARSERACTGSITRRERDKHNPNRRCLATYDLPFYLSNFQRIWNRPSARSSSPLQAMHLALSSRRSRIL